MSLSLPPLLHNEESSNEKPPFFCCSCCCCRFPLLHGVLTVSEHLVALHFGITHWITALLLMMWGRVGGRESNKRQRHNISGSKPNIWHSHTNVSQRIHTPKQTNKIKLKSPSKKEHVNMPINWSIWNAKKYLTKKKKAVHVACRPQANKANIINFLPHRMSTACSQVFTTAAGRCRNTKQVSSKW